MTWWDTANDPDASAGRRAAAAVGCGMLPWVCLVQEGAESARETAEETATAVRDRVTGEAGGGLMGDLRDTIHESGEALAAPVTAYSKVLMWSAVLVGVLLLVVVLGLVVWYVVLPYAKGGPGASSG